MISLIPNGTPLREFNHMHDRMGRFSSGGGGGSLHQAPDTGSGGGASGGETGGAATKSMWDQPRFSIAYLQKRLQYYKTAHRGPENAEQGEISDPHAAIAAITTAIANKRAVAAGKKAARASAAPAGPAMHNGTELTPGHLASLPINSLARIVSQDWRKQGKGVNYAAKPYLDALHSMDKISDPYGQDSGHSIAAYFLGNATSWKGPVAKAVKAELNRRLKGK